MFVAYNRSTTISFICNIVHTFSAFFGKNVKVAPDGEFNVLHTKLSKP